MAPRLALLGLLLALAGCTRSGAAEPRRAAGGITIKGSGTMVHLVEAWAERYRAEHPEQEVSVTGGGSGTGIAALLNGTAEVCMASRAMKHNEHELAAERAVAVEEHVVARDGIAIVVHPHNPLDSLTLTQLERVFTGAVTNWQEVGGEDRRIIVLSRETSSGTYVFFAERVLRKQDFTHRARLMPSTGAIIQSTSQDEGSVGYVGLGYAEGARVKVLAVAAEGAPVHPTLATVSRGDYPISRPLFLYTPRARNRVAEGFLAFATSERGQEIVVESGYIPRGPEQ